MEVIRDKIKRREITKKTSTIIGKYFPNGLKNSVIRNNGEIVIPRHPETGLTPMGIGRMISKIYGIDNLLTITEKRNKTNVKAIFKWQPDGFLLIKLFLDNRPIFVGFLDVVQE